MSVFRAANNNPNTPPREAYPLNRAKDDGIPDGPTERIDDRLVRRRRRRQLLIALLPGLLAVNLAAVAVFVSWRASTMARAALHAPAPAAGPPARDFDVSYAREPLRVQVGCSSIMYIDLNEPRANAGEQASDLRYDSRCGDQPPRLTLGPGAAGGSQVADTDLDAGGCAKAIRTSPLGPGASVDVRKGVVLCVLTTGAPAAMVLVEITDVARTGMAGMRATSWKVSG